MGNVNIEFLFKDPVFQGLGLIPCSDEQDTITKQLDINGLEYFF